VGCKVHVAGFSAILKINFDRLKSFIFLLKGRCLAGHGVALIKVLQGGPCGTGFCANLFAEGQKGFLRNPWRG